MCLFHGDTKLADWWKHTVVRAGSQQQQKPHLQHQPPQHQAPGAAVQPPRTLSCLRLGREAQPRLAAGARPCYLLATDPPDMLPNHFKPQCSYL